MLAEGQKKIFRKQTPKHSLLPDPVAKMNTKNKRRTGPSKLAEAQSCINLLSEISLLGARRLVLRRLALVQLLPLFLLDAHALHSPRTLLNPSSAT